MLDRLQQWWERRFFRVAAYMGFGFFAFVMFLLITFPEHRVRQIASNELEAALDFEYEVSIGELGFWRLTGASAENITLRERLAGEDTDGGDDEEGGPMPTMVQVERISGRLAPIRTLLGGGPALDFQVDVGGSVVEGDFDMDGYNQQATQTLSLAMDELDLRQSTLLTSLTGQPIYGILDGDVEVVIDGARGGLITDGHVDITGQQLTLGSTVIEIDSVPLLTGLELPTTSFGNLELYLDFEENERGSRLNFDTFKTQGRDIMTEAWGHMDITPRGNQPRVEMRLQVSQEYVSEHGLSSLFSMGEFRQGEYGDWYGFVIAGRPGNINFEGSRTAAQGPDGASDDGDDGDDAPEGAPEAPPEGAGEAPEGRREAPPEGRREAPPEGRREAPSEGAQEGREAPEGAQDALERGREALERRGAGVPEEARD